MDFVVTIAAKKAPKSAPSVVAISRNIPILILEKPSFTYAAAAPDDVAITETSDAPTAYRISTLNTRVKNGTSTTPPPSPVSDPRKPAVNDPIATRAVNSRFVIHPPELVCHR